ncbi:outer membrane protein [Sphingomonas corticis]|jgi:outer membrane immunogenic protein|uniref:Porin family protein n=1 Tax=Sphingomonas corticis TaxID=2722791 RepID=A0ABX1CPC8_9SPHN|nr:porin family protein [Sphingomonas corticis]NJR77582.1 porin family protein [Sphingomonas corticis]
MRKFLIAAATAATALSALPAAAQEIAPFTGARVEALVGYDNLQDGGDGESDGRDGVSYGALVGYDFQVGGLVIGAEGEATDSSVRVRSRENFVAGDSLRLDAGRDLYVGGRVGYAISPLAMIYAKGGYTNARIESRYSTTSGNVTTTVTDKSDLDGYRVGAGLEYNITPSAYVKGEYRYSHYGDLDGIDIDLDRHQLMAGVGIRF